MTETDLTFPPLFRGEAVGPGVTPMDRAIMAAMRGTDPGLVTFRAAKSHAEAAIVLAPECPLEDAMAMVFAAALGFSDALGALAPPEVGLHTTWPDGFRVNGARCGGLHAAASTTDPAAVPEWLVVGFEVPFLYRGDVEPGARPDDTALVMEGCGEITPERLIESWSRHLLVWINTWDEDGLKPLHEAWRSKAFDMGKEIDLTIGSHPTRSGTFMGLDDKGGLLLRDGEATTLIPLTEMLRPI